MKKHLSLLLLIFTLFISCEKQEGEGGKNTITGVVIMQEYTESTNQFIIEYPAIEERVYIIYGDNSYYADETRTNYDGTFQFDYLYKGDYQIFLYSECLACAGDLEVQFYDVELKERKEVYELDTIYIKNYVN